MYPNLEYLITETERQQILAAEPPPSTRNILDGLVAVEKAYPSLVDTRQTSVSAWMFLMPPVLRLLGVREGSPAGKPLKMVGKALSLSWEFLILLGAFVLFAHAFSILAPGFATGLESVKSFSGLAAAILIGTLAFHCLRLLKVVFGTTASIPKSGYKISEHDLKQVLSSGKVPGFVFRIIDNLPLLEQGNYQICEAGSAPEASPTVPSQTAPSTTPRRLANYVRRFVIATALFASVSAMAYQAFLSTEFNTFELIGLTAFVLNGLSDLVAGVWEQVNRYQVNRRQNLTW